MSCERPGRHRRSVRLPRPQNDMTCDPTIHHRCTIRLPTYDYAQPGAYFVTVVCRGRVLLLDDPALRAVAEEAWLWLAGQYVFVDLDAFVVMPNHLHGIIILNDICRGGSRTAPTRGPRPKTLGRLVGAYKTVSTKRINEMRSTPGLLVWQRNYYEHVIRNDEELDRVRQYIGRNPALWAEDPENPDRWRFPV